MTSIGRRFIALMMIAAIAGTLARKDALTLVAVGGLCLVFGHWCLFQVRIALLRSNISCTRRLQGRSTQRTATLWVDRTTDVSLVLSTSAGSFPSLTLLRDWLPDALSLSSGEPEMTIFESKRQIELNYTAEVLAADTTCFPGVFIRFHDTLGMFHKEHFLEFQTHIRCLPSHQVREGLKPTVKRLNSLPQHGIHRLQRAGLGSELLELREYQPGDPPKSIAWKVSARRDQLMTRQYESEVPVRITMFVDGSGSARSGPLSRRPIDNMNRIAANVASAAVHSGDQFGLVTIDEHACHWHAPGYGNRALQASLRELATFSNAPVQNPASRPASHTKEIMRRLHRICMARYPEAMLSDVNVQPFSIFPISPWARTAWKERVQLANTICGVYGLDATICGLMYTDDRLLLKYGVQLARDNGRLISTLGSPTNHTSSWDWSETFHQQIIRAITVARDNEVFVILTNVLGRQSELTSLLDLLKLAVARHHRVVVISPELGKNDLQITPGWLGARRSGYDASSIQESDILSRAAIAQQELTIKHLKRRLRKTGASVSFASPGVAAQIVLEEASLAGSGRTTRSQ